MTLPTVYLLNLKGGWAIPPRLNKFRRGLLALIVMNFIESEDIAPTERGSGGFGSTGL